MYIRVLNRWRAGESIESIASHYGVSSDLVQEWLREGVTKEISDVKNRKAWS